MYNVLFCINFIININIIISIININIIISSAGMPVIINILPNVYWLYNNPNNIQSTGDYKIEMHKFVESNNIKSIIELDEKLAFWQKSASYINEIKVQMEKDEFSKLLAMMKKLNDVIKNAYTTNIPFVISTYSQKYIEIGLAIWIYFFNQTADISFDNVIKLLGYKIIGNVFLSDIMKKFFALLNLSHVTNSI